MGARKCCYLYLVWQGDKYFEVTSYYFFCEGVGWAGEEGRGRGRKGRSNGKEGNGRKNN